MRAFGFFLALLTLALGQPLSAAAQWSVTSWVPTELDEHVTVQLPYVTEPAPIDGMQGSRQYTTDTENIVLYVGSLDLRYQPTYNPNGVVTVESLNKFFDRLIRTNVKSFRADHIRLVSQGNAVFAGSPARVARFSCFDEVRQQPAYLDFIYAWRGDVLYMFGSAYRLPETEATLADKKRFLESVRFDNKVPAKEL
ncbi:hypothetical protein [Hymenobacter sp. CRA2]|uniref:hypothetical protein n=1 Tax=Hymenobacter sp. CRA2 TaxID=1955620 RepID=UPI00098F8F2E|nr:hypothetical protein [Hymenobacter sp. CRA2]OON69772.1 hypothetical protein B0919_07550 [Hymenobacter sp. CRA2]